MSEVAIRPATPDDAEACATILRDWITATPWMPNLHTPAEDVAFVRKLISGEDVTVAIQEDAVAGFLSRKGSEVSCLYIGEEYRGRGIGKKLIDSAKAAARHLTLWTFQANAGARRFYARHGFLEVELTDGQRNEEKLPDVRLEWFR